MREILTELDRWQQEDEEIALATLVRVRGSAPRLPGARLALTRSGRMAGSVSGGCVEHDVFERAMGVLDSGQPAMAAYGIADDLAIEVGLSCGGSIDVLIEQFVADEAWLAVRRAAEGRRPAALAIALTPASLLGRKLAVFDEGSDVGSVDPALDGKVAAQLRRVLRDGESQVLSLPYQEQEATVFAEAFSPPPRMFIVGATHVAMSLCPMAKRLGFDVSVIDARGLFVTEERFPEADRLVRDWPDEALDADALDAYSYVVVLSHDPKFDIPALARALRSGARYVGAMGNPETHRRRRTELERQGFSQADLGRIKAPIGLDIGGRTADEIALSILAEVVAVQNGRVGSAAIRDVGTWPPLEAGPKER